MIAFVGFLILVTATLGVLASASRRSRTEQIRRDLLRADQQVHVEHRKARRAMNDAAGQSWRNLAE